MKLTSPPAALQPLRARWAEWEQRRRITRLAAQVAAHTPPGTGRRVVMFNASTRIGGLSLNAAFALLTGWALRLAGAQVEHFVCESGLEACVLGLNRQDLSAGMACRACLRQSAAVYARASRRPLAPGAHPELQAALAGLNVADLSRFEYADARFAQPIPLGRLALPAARWTLRRHHLPEGGGPPQADPALLLRRYLTAAHHTAVEFDRLIERTRPNSAVIFNGMMFPEAAARWVCRQRGLRNLAHEVGFQRFSTFFTDGEPTAYPIPIPADFELDAAQNTRLDAYLERRFQGNFSMAGIQFWPEMRRLDAALLERIAAHRQLVPIFTNVIYDTSQVHANTVFPHMFAWLDAILPLIRSRPETFFVIRAHPDEKRPGTAKISNESVSQWVEQNGVARLPNVAFIDSGEYLSSYELIQRAKFVLVYNSSIGLEAALLKTAVICGGKARYTQYPAVYLPESPRAFSVQAAAFLDDPAGRIPLPPEFERNARRFLYYQLYRASIPLGRYLEDGLRPGFVHLQNFDWQELLPERSLPLRVIVEGILDGQPFIRPEIESLYA
jgi:hypothetical protein